MTTHASDQSSEQLNKLTTSWLQFIECIVHDVRTPLLSISLFCSALEELFPDLIKSYRLAVEHGLIEPHLPERRLKALEKNGFGDTQESIDWLFDFFQSAHDYTKDVSDASAMQSFSIKQCISHLLEKYPFSDEKQRHLIEVNFHYDFTFQFLPIFVDSLFYHLLKNALYRIEQENRGEIHLWTEEKNNFYLLHFKDTSGVSEYIPSTEWNRFFSKHGTGENQTILPGLGFCKLALLQVNGDLSCDVMKNEYIDFVIQFPKITDNLSLG